MIQIPIFLNILILLISFWLLSAIIFLLHRLSPRISLSPLIFTLGAYTAALQFRSLGLITYSPLSSELILSIGAFILLPNILLGLLLIYIVYGSTAARNLLFGLILISLLIGFYQFTPSISKFYTSEISIVQSQSIPPARIPISSAITLCMDFIVLVVVYQSISNLRRRYPSKLAGGLALLLTLIFDAFAFPFFAYFGTSFFLTQIPANLIGKIIASLMIWPLFSLYLYSIPKSFPLSAASSHRTFLDIFSSNIQQYENNLLTLNQLTTELVQIHDLQEIFDTISLAEEEMLLVDASIIVNYDIQAPQQHNFYTHNIEKKSTECLQNILYEIIEDQRLVRDQFWAIKDTSKMDRFPDCKQYLIEHDFRSSLFLPIYHYETIIGIHLLLFHRTRSFTAAEIQFALTVTNSLSIALQNANLYQSEHNQRRFAEALEQASAVLNSTLNLDKLLERILEETMRVVPCRSANLMLVKEDQVTIVRQIQQQENGEYKSLNYGPSIPLSTLTLQHMINTSGPLLISTTHSHPLWQDLGTSDWINSYAAAPLQIRGQTTGFLGVNSDQPDYFNDETISRLQAFASHAAAALHNARLYQHLQDYSIDLENRVQERTAELSSAKNRIEVILNAIPEAVFVLDANDKLLEANQAGNILFKQALDSGFDLFNPSLLNQLKKSHLSDEKGNLEFNQRSFQALASRIPLANNMIGLVIVYRDVTLFRELDQMKNQFVSDVSHELRTPLTNLNLYLDLLSTEKQTSLRQSYLDTLQRETHRLTVLIEDLLTISRIESGRTQIQMQAVDIASLVRDLIKDRQQMASERGLELKIEIPSELPLAKADPRSINQVLSNLLTNALIYTLPGGSIRLTVNSTKMGISSWIEIAISDTGVGIKPHELPHIFERFYRGSSSQLTKAPGTGLGLAISKEILERMGGRIQVDSNPNIGSTFTIWIQTMP